MVNKRINSKKNGKQPIAMLSKIKEYEELLLKLASPILNELSLDLLYIESNSESGTQVFTLYIDHKYSLDDNNKLSEIQSPSIDDCALVSKRLSLELDEALQDDYPFILEISSPGLDRKLVREQDYQRFQLSRIKIKLKIGEESKVYKGILSLSSREGFYHLQTDKEKIEFSLDQVIFAKLHPDFSQLL